MCVPWCFLGAVLLQRQRVYFLFVKIHMISLWEIRKILNNKMLMLETIFENIYFRHENAVSNMFYGYLETHEEESGIPQALILFTFDSERYINYFRSSNKNNTYIPHFKVFENSKKLTHVARLLE